MNRTAVVEIKERIPVEDLIGSYVKLEKSGKSYKAKCPFHNEKTPSFFVSPDRGGYYCFGCGAKGDIFSFVEQFEGLDFRGALKILADKAGVKLVYDQKADSEKDRLFEIMERAAVYFEEQYSKSAEAQAYIKSRGISEATRKEFRIGWAPEGWRNLSTFLKNKGWNDVTIEKAGLAKRKDQEAGSNVQQNDCYDRFRGRIMFPINDSSGRVVAFTGRILKDDGKSAKYLNSPDTPLYDKSLILYGLDKAKSEIRRLNYSILVEGQMDLVMSYQAGIKNTVASSGTALSDETASEKGNASNLTMIRRLSPNVIIAFDSDLAGRKAALRASAIALSMGMDVKIADIVGGKDPADLVKEDVNKWREALKQAKPVVEFELNNVMRELSAENIAAKGPAASNVARKVPRVILDRVLPLLARMESASDQSYFIAMISDRAGIPTDALWQDLRMVEKKLKEKEAPAVKATPNSINAKVPHRIDLVERQLFGMIFMVERDSPELATTYRDRLKKISSETYDERSVRAESLKGDLIFEAEEYFGNNKEDWPRHLDELFTNFEEDMMNVELFEAMRQLRIAEKNNDQAVAIELAKKCQVLSIRKAEIARRKK